MSIHTTTYCLERLTDYAAFESLCSDLMGAQGYKAIEPLGGPSDSGRDALYVDTDGAATVFAYSVRRDWQRKLRSDAAHASRHCYNVHRFVFVTTQRVSSQKRDTMLKETWDRYKWHLDIFGLERLRVLLDAVHPDIKTRFPSVFPVSLEPSRERTPLHVLMAVAAEGCYQNFAEMDMCAIADALEKAPIELQMDCIVGPSAVELGRALSRGVDILHILANVTREGGVPFWPETVFPAQLKEILRGKGVRLIVLMTCNALNTASAMEDADVLAMISTARYPRGYTETRFISGLYAALASGSTISEAFALARDDYVLSSEEAMRGRFWVEVGRAYDLHLLCHEDVRILSTGVRGQEEKRAPTTPRSRRGRVRG
jgi:hypothetical protein